jgi:hypothetical protein
LIPGIISFLAMMGASQIPQVTDVRPPPPPPVVFPEHHRNPQSRIVNTNYACTDGTRLIRVAYEQFPKGSITTLVRNGRSASQDVINKVNSFVAHFDYLTAIFPQCGMRDDVFTVTGISKGRRADILVRWTPTSANLDAVLR